MSVVLTISNRNIRLIEGTFNGNRITVNKALVHSIPAEFMDQGMMEKEEETVQKLKQFWEANRISKKDVRLLFANRKVSMKLMETPELKEKELVPFFEREFLDYENTKSQIYSYQSIAQKTAEKMQMMLAAKVEQEELEKYQKLFAAAGISLTMILNLPGALIYQVSRQKEVKGKNCIVQVEQGASVTNLLFLDGVYNYSNTVQIFEERGTIAFAIEVARSVSEILQFMQANQISRNDMMVYLEDFSVEDEANCIESIEQMNSELIVESRRSSIEVTNRTELKEEEFLPACYGLLKYPKTMDFLPAFLKKRKADKKNPEMFEFLKPVFLLTGILAVVTAGLGIYDAVNYSKLKELKSFNEDPSTVSVTSLYDAEYEKAVVLQDYVNNIGELQARIASYPVAVTELEDDIMATAEACQVTAEVQSFDAATGVIAINATSEEVDRIHHFIDELKGMSIVHNVDYTGYDKKDSTTLYQMNLVCYLSEYAGKEAE